MNDTPTDSLGILGPKAPEPGDLHAGRPNSIVELDDLDIDNGTFQWLRDGVPIDGAMTQTCHRANDQPDRILAMLQFMLEFAQHDRYNQEAA